MGQITSPRAVGQRLAIIALALGIGAAAVACASGPGAKSVSLKSPSGPPGAPSPTASTTSPTTGTDNSGAAGTGQPSAGPGTTTQHRGTTTATAPPGGRTATTPAPSTPRVTTPVASGPAPATPGTYSYNLVSGTSTLTTGSTTTTLAVPPVSTLVVTSGVSGTQQWVNSATTVILAFNNSGVFLLSEMVPLANNATCTFSSPVASPPWPLAVGKTFSGDATCGQGQSASSLSLRGKVSGTASVPLDGGFVNTFMVQSTLTLGTSLTVAETDWYTPSLRVPVKTTVVAQGGISGYSVSSTTTYALTSSRPS